MGYFGSEATSGLCQAIIAMMPPHDTYIETHLGGGAVMKRKPPALENIGSTSSRVRIPASRLAYDFQGSEGYSDPPYLRCARTSGRRYRFDYEEASSCSRLPGLDPSAKAGDEPGRRAHREAVVQDRVHWASHAGRLTDRQRIKRKAASWGRRYRALPRAERLAVLASVMAVEAEA